MKAEVKQIAVSLANELVDLENLLMGETVVDEDGYKYGDIVDYLNDRALEIYGNARVGGGYYDLQEIVIVFGTGGPHREIVVNRNGDAEGRACWGSDSHSAWLGHSALFDYLAEIVAPEAVS